MAFIKQAQKIVADAIADQIIKMFSNGFQDVTGTVTGPIMPNSWQRLALAASNTAEYMHDFSTALHT